MVQPDVAKKKLSRLINKLSWLCWPLCLCTPGLCFPVKFQLVIHVSFLLASKTGWKLCLSCIPEEAFRERKRSIEAALGATKSNTVAYL